MVHQERSDLLAGWTLDGPGADLAVSRSYEPRRDVVTAVQNSVDGDTLSRYDYSYDAGARRSGVAAHGLAFEAGSMHTRWGYNGRSELTSALRYFGTNTSDVNGNVSEYLAEDGSVAAHYEYGPFGQTVVASGSAPMAFPHRFSTKFLDDQSGLYYYGLRFYSGGMGRWLSRDPAGEQDDHALQNYVRNDPAGFFDAVGLAATSIMMADALTGPQIGLTTKKSAAGSCGELEVEVQIDADPRTGRNTIFEMGVPEIGTDPFIGITVDFYWRGEGGCVKPCCCKESTWVQTLRDTNASDPVVVFGSGCKQHLVDSPGFNLSGLGRWFKGSLGRSFRSSAVSSLCFIGFREEAVVEWDYTATKSTLFGPWTVSYRLIAVVN